MHILCTACADIKGENYSPDTFEFWLGHCYYGSVVNIWCFNWLVWKILVQFRFHITVIADTDQGKGFCLLKFHYIRIYENNKGAFLRRFQVAYGAIYVLWAQELANIFPSFYIKEFHYICLKRLFERYENFHLLVNITMCNFSLRYQAIHKSSTYLKLWPVKVNMFVNTLQYSLWLLQRVSIAALRKVPPATTTLSSW